MELIAAVILILALIFGEITLYQKRGTHGLSYYCKFSQTEVTEGETVLFTEVTENAKALPIPYLKAEITLSKWLHFPDAQCVVTDQSRFLSSFFSVRGHAKIRRVWKVQCEKRGVYAVENVVLVTSDLLGAVRLSLHATETGETITVLPKRFISAGLILPRLMQKRFGENPVRHNLRTDPCLPAGVREYVIGDPQNHIHWKASVHAQKLLVRQEEPIANQIITVLLALNTNTADSGNVTYDNPLMEHTIRVCAQCLWELLHDGWIVRLCINEANSQQELYQTKYGGGMKMYHNMLECLASLSLQHILPMSQLLRLGTSSAHRETLLLITPYTDKQVAQWKQNTNGLLLVTGHAHDFAKCADAVIPQLHNKTPVN